MSTKILSVSLGASDNSLNLKISDGVQTVWQDFLIKESNYGEASSLQIYYFLLNALKSVYELMPFDKVRLICSRELVDKHSKILSHCQNILMQTNKILQELDLHPAKEHSGREKLLFINVDENERFKSLYGKLVSLDKDRIVYLNMKSGFDPIRREWQPAITLPLTFDEFLQLLRNENITTVVSSNHYFLEAYLFELGINLIPVLRRIGVEYIILDNDPKDQNEYGYLAKSALHCDDFKHFGFNIINQYWDDHYRLKNVYYIAMFNQYDEQREVAQLTEDCGVVILSNSRVKDVTEQLGSIIYLLDKFDQDNIVYDLEMWYYATRHLILNVMPLSDYLRLRLNTKLFVLFYSATQFLKYDVIDSLDKNREIYLYGDVGWSELFPDLYSGFLAGREKAQLFEQPQHLFLLMNWQTSWLDASGPIYDAISRQVPFLSYPPLVTTSPLKGMKYAVYHNAQDLNEKIVNINAQFQQKELSGSLNFLKKLYNQSIHATAQSILCNVPVKDNSPDFCQQWELHSDLLDRQIKSYLDRHETLLRDVFDVLLAARPSTYNASNSVYFNKPYFQKLVASMS